jgi:excinuclease ABC subunit C
LLQRFGSLRRLMAATVEELATVPGIGAELAAVIVERLKAVEEPTMASGKKRLVLKPIASR